MYPAIAEMEPVNPGLDSRIKGPVEHFSPGHLSGCGVYRK